MRNLFLIGCLYCISAVPVSAEEITASTPAIVWERTVMDGFIKAVEEKRPLVIVFTMSPSYRSPSGTNFSNLTMEQFDAPELQALAGDAVFVICQFDHRTGRMRDEHGRRIWNKLKLTSCPTVSIIAPTTKSLTEVFRIEGTFEAQVVAGHLKVNIPKALAAANLDGSPAAPELKPTVTAPATPAAPVAPPAPSARLNPPAPPAAYIVPEKWISKVNY